MNRCAKTAACVFFAVTGLFLLHAQEEDVSEESFVETIADEQVFDSQSVFDSIDEYTGWSYMVDKHAVAENRDVRIRLRGDNGTFALYTINGKGKEVSLLSSNRSHAGSFFSMKVGRKQYVLNFEGGVTSEARKTEHGVQLVYTVPKKLYFVLDFSFPNEDVSEPLQNIVRVTMYTVNIGQTPQSFSLKGVFDTVLGETSGRHFSTATIEKLNRQKRFHVMSDDKWIRSANGNTAIQFMLNGTGITEPEEVTVSSPQSLAKYWFPDVVESRGFATPSSYNDSGIGVNWKTAYLNPEEMDVKVFYLSIAEGLAPIYEGKEPAGLEFLSALEKKEPVFPVLPEKEFDAEDVVAPAEPVVLSPAAQAVTEEQLDPEYIQNLIDYIESIQSEEDIESEELASLNKELDAIFERLRSTGKKNE